MCNMYETIAKLCKNRNISIAQMCRELGLRQGLISDLKHGRTSDLSTKNLGKIAAYFGVTIDYLLGNEKSSGEPEDSEDIIEMREAVRRNPDLRVLFPSPAPAKGSPAALVVAGFPFIRADLRRFGQVASHGFCQDFKTPVSTFGKHFANGKC